VRCSYRLNVLQLYIECVAGLDTGCCSDIYLLQLYVSVTARFTRALSLSRGGTVRSRVLQL